MKINIIAATAALTLGLAGTVPAADWATADGSCFKKGDKQITAGINVYYFGPNVAFDMAFHDAISGGGIIGINWWGDPLWHETRVPILVRAAFHPFNLKILADKIKVRDKLDTYAGIGMGWTIGWESWAGYGVSPTNDFVGGFTVREYVGARYYFTPKFDVNAELIAEEGGSTDVLNIGVGFKF